MQVQVSKIVSKGKAFLTTNPAYLSIVQSVVHL